LAVRTNISQVLKIAQNTAECLHHGWFAVKNRSTIEIQQGVTITDRHQREKIFFTASPWNQLPKDRVGIDSLKKYLAHLLYEHIRGEFPGLVQEIRDLVEISRNDLELLGPSRQTILKQRQFITGLAARYQREVNDSLTGNYDSRLEVDHPLKLRMHLQNANGEFGKTVEREGHTRAFRLVDGTIDKNFTCGRYEENIYEWIREVYHQSRGAELPGTVNTSALENMFRLQSENWAPIAYAHIATIESIMDNFNQSLLENIISEDSLRAKFQLHNAPFHKDTKTKAAEQLRNILNDERSGILQTANHYFADNLSSIRQERVLHRLKSLGYDDGSRNYVDLAAIAGAVHLSNECQAVNDIHDILKSFYKVAMKRFMDNIIVQVVERHYLGPEGPVKALCPAYFGGLPDSQLSEIAAENYATFCSRMEIGNKLTRLEKALLIAEDLSL
jgi:hypothetical protein